MSDTNARIRSNAVKLLSASLNPIRRLPRSDANVFSEYILPIVTNVKICRSLKLLVVLIIIGLIDVVQLAQDESVLVRSTLAQHVAELAEIALKFLEISHWQITTAVSYSNTPTETSCDATFSDSQLCGNGFDGQLHQLQVTIDSQQTARTQETLYYIISEFLDRNHSNL